MATTGNSQRLPVQVRDGPVTSAAGIVNVAVLVPNGLGTGYRERPWLISPTQISLWYPATVFWFTQTASGLNSPEAVWVNQNTVAGYHNDIWVGDINHGLSRYPVPNPLGTNTATLTMPAAEVTGPSLTCSASLCEFPVVAITQDSYGALYVADTSNRVAIHYPALSGTNGASFVCAMGCNLGTLTDAPYYLAPGAYASLFPFSGSFGSST